jgi:hypothetical protein
MPIRFAATLVACLLAAPCLAREVTIGGTPVDLTAPSGQCELEAGRPGDARMLQTTETALSGVGNRLLAFFADCKQLDDWRAGKRPLLEDFAQYQAAAATIGAPPPPAPDDIIKQNCAAQRKEGERTLSRLATDIKTRIEEAIRGVTVNQVRFLGVVGEEPGVCYGAIVQRFRAETGKDVTIVGVYATMFVRGKLVHYYLYTPYRSAQTVTALVARHKLNVAALLAANRKAARAPAPATHLASARRSW